MLKENHHNNSESDEEEEGMDDKLESFVLEATRPSPETSPTMATTFITESMDEINEKETTIMPILGLLHRRGMDHRYFKGS